MKRYPGLSESLARRVARAQRRATRGRLGGWAWVNAGDLRSRAGRGQEPRAQRSETRAQRCPARVADGWTRHSLLATRHSGRRGSTLLVVLALLGMLSLLGMIYFSFANQEQQNAIYFAEAARRPDDPGDDIDAIFNEALRQLIQGADYAQKNSVLWGGRHSLARNLLGYDRQPYSGTGVNLIFVPGTGWASDQNRDGVPDPVQPGYNLVDLNDSPAARPDLFERNPLLMPAPDVDYTYPDHNNMFLTHDAYTFDFNVYPPRKTRVIKPAFHRPELFRDGGFSPVANWATVGGAGGRSFRPHPDHLFVWRQPSNATPERRFLDASNPADAALIAALPGTSGGFPFQVDLDGDGNFNEQGIWDRVLTNPNTFDEDLNGNGMLDPGEDLNGNGMLDSKPYEYDVDNDLDNVRDGIWMDLDLPVSTRPSDNATYLPLVSFKVVDLGGKLDLNSIGNQSGDTRTAATSDFGNGFDIHRSSLGLSTFEINPLWALDTHPTEATSVTDHTKYFHVPTTTRHLANMEWWWFNKGRVAYNTPIQIFAGRYGEADRVWNVLATAGMAPAISVQQVNSNLFPFPGVWNADDNRDANEGGPFSLTGVLGGQSLAFRHPLALNGYGAYWNPANPKQLDLRSIQQLEDANNNGVLDPGEDLNGNGILDTGPVMFVRYTGMGIGADGNGNGNVDLLNDLNGALMRNTLVGANFAVPTSPNPTLLDDPHELTLEEKFIIRPYDEPLEPRDTLYFYLSKGDRDRTGITSRVADLMPGNFVPGTTGAQHQLEVAKRFTTVNWDLKTFPLPRIPGVRDWEFNVDLDGDGLPEFPPQFTGGSGTERAFQPNDPFRPQLRRLLYNELGDTQEVHHAFKLDVNQFLDVERLPNQPPPDPVTAPLRYRPLTPHSTDSTLTTVPAASPLPPYPPMTEGDKEFWARRDRQQMARDIYVLLYTFCGGNDNFNPTTMSGMSGANSYPENTRRMMAQFAVNLVDALDRDNVITAFEYDNNLANGWNLDDDPYSVTAAEAALPAGERGVVYGVEAQELTFSEVLWLWQPQAGTDHDRTPFNETVGDHNFLQIELRSVSSKSVPLASTVSTAANTGVWRIHRDDNTDSVVDGTENALIFSNGAGSVASGGLFTIASADASPVGSASLYIDFAGAMSMGMTRHDELVAPNLPTGTIYTGSTLPPEANLDLLHPSHSTRFVLQNGGASSGDLLSRNNNPANGGGAADTTHLRLDRRLNPYCPQLTLGANPWITVDTFRGVTRRDLKIDGGVVSQTDVANRLSATAPFATPTISSQERRQPFDANGISPGASTGGSSPHLNSIGRTNPSSPVGTNLHQIHFDRDFASVTELFNIPLRSPVGLTRIVRDMRRPAETPTATPNAQKGQVERGGFAGPVTFGAAVLMQSEDANENGVLDTEDTNGNGVLDMGEDTNGNGILDTEDMNGNGYLDFPGGEDRNSNGVLDAGEDYNSNMMLDSGTSAPNHFHRLLSLIEVPTRSHRQLGDPLKLTRVPGKPNLNGITEPQVLAALIDERAVMDAPERDINLNGVLDPGEDLNGNGQFDEGLPDRTGEPPESPSSGDLDGSGAVDNPGRDWWFNFLISRDGIDPTSGVPLPMSGVSSPFRDLGTLRPSLTSTITKNPLNETVLRALPTSLGGRRLFELGTENPGSPAADEFLNGVVDPTLRHRLLSKVINNSTTRGNTFLVFVTIGMFECVELPNGAVRVGGHMDVDGDGQPDTHRAVFLIDRSIAEDAYDKGSGTFDWKKLVTARQRIN